MHNARWRLIVTMAVSVLTRTAHPGASQAPVNTASVRSLSADIPIDTTLAPGGTHTYTFAAAANDFLHIVIEEHGVDVVATFSAPDTRQLLRVDSLGDDFAVNTVVAIAPAGGVYSVVIQAAADAWTEGRYGIRLQPLHVVTPGDEKRIDAERMFLAARRLRTTGGVERAKALAELPRAMAIFRELGDQDAVLRTLMEQTWLEHQLGRPTFYDTSMQTVMVARTIGGYAIARPTYLLAIAQERRGEMADALRLVNEAVQIGRDFGDRRFEGSVFNEMGVLYARTGQDEPAIDAFERSLDIARVTKSRDAEQVALANLGIAYKNLGDFERSLDRYNAALPLAES